MTRFPRERPGAGARVYKGHGLGNDYLVVEEGSAWTLDGEAVERVCHRLEGVGGDGIVVLLASSGQPFPLRMFNPDGGEFERSGNGLRVLASWLHRTGRVTAGEAFRVRVGGDAIEMTVHGVDASEVYDVSVTMGRATTGPGAVALEGEALGADGTLEHPEHGPIPVHLVGVGNPHCVVHVDELEGTGGGLEGPGDLLSRPVLDRLGPWLATHPAFAHGTNVQLARVAERHEGGGGVVDALIWERGVGHTTASGTSSCAVAVSAVASGRLDAGPVELRLEGGSLHVEVSDALDVVLRGPVAAVFEGEISAGFLRSLPRAATSAPVTAAPPP